MSQDVEGAPSGPRICPQCGTQYAADIRFCPVDGWALRAPAGDSNLVGEVLDDRYLIVRKLGEGGMGQVYLADHVTLPKQYAIKVMNPHLLHDADAAGRFGREARSSCRIAHPNVAAVYDYGETSHGITYLVMEYVDGEPLSQLLRRESPLAPPRAVAIARQLAEALGAAHELGIIHRDLKPENVMVTRAHGRRDVVKLVDFGIARVIADEQRLTRTGLVVGTPAYMSPEQINGDPLDGRSDIYSLGCILHEMLTGEPPFTGPSGEAAMRRRLTEPPPHPRHAKAYVPKALDEAVAKALARSPQDRFQSADDFAAVLAIPESDSPLGSRWPRAWSGVRDAIRARITPGPAFAPPLSIETLPADLTAPAPDTHAASAADSLPSLAVEPPPPAPPAPPAPEPPAADLPAPDAVPVAPVPVPWATQPTQPIQPPRITPRRRKALLGAAATAAAVALVLAMWPRGDERSAGGALIHARSRADSPLVSKPRATPAPLAVVAPDDTAPALAPGDSAPSAQAPPPATAAPADTAYDRALALALRGRQRALRSRASRQELAAGDALRRAAEALAQRGDDAAARTRLAAAARSWSKAAEVGRARMETAQKDSAMRDQVAAIRRVVHGFVAALAARQMAEMQRFFPAMPAEQQGFWQDQFRQASAWSAAVLDEDTATVAGASAQVRFRYRAGQGRVQPVNKVMATLRHDPNGWHIQALERAP